MILPIIASRIYSETPSLRRCAAVVALVIGFWIGLWASAGAQEYGHGDDDRERVTFAVAKSSARAPRYSGSIIGGRPAGCPSKFCGCALSLKLFGKIIPRLNLAANWLTFPRTRPAPGMVAARRGHVFKLVAHVAGDRWTVWDANSGGGKIRIHERRISSYVVVDPYASRVALAVQP